MVLILHIVIAISSMLATGWAYLFPSRRRLYMSGSLIGLTLVSGTYLVVNMHAHLLQACITGLFYLAIVCGGMVLARHRLVKQEVAAIHHDMFGER